MRADAASRRYARALFQLADEQGVVDDVARALGIIDEVLQEPTVGAVLMGPGNGQRKRALLAQMGERAAAPPMLQDFLSLVAARDRIAQVPGIHAAFRALVDRARNVTRAVVRAATTPSDEVLAEVARVFGTLTGKQVVAEVEVDGDLIAGLVVEVEGRVYDGSLRTQLAKLHRQMASG